MQVHWKLSCRASTSAPSKLKPAKFCLAYAPQACSITLTCPSRFLHGYVSTGCGLRIGRVLVRVRLHTMLQNPGKIEVFEGAGYPELVVLPGAVERIDNLYFRLLVV